MAINQRETLKKIYNSMSEEERLEALMLKRLYRSVLRGNKVEAGVLSKAIVILFPKRKVVMVTDTVFKALWKLKKYPQAIKLYVGAGRPFWHTEEVAGYYESRGMLKEAMFEYEHLIKAYSKIGRGGLLPLPKGPRALFRLGQWFSLRNRTKARRYIKLYLSAEQKCGTDPAFHLRHKNAAKRILGTLAGAARDDASAKTGRILYDR